MTADVQRCLIRGCPVAARGMGRPFVCGWHAGGGTSDAELRQAREVAQAAVRVALADAVWPDPGASRV